MKTVAFHTLGCKVNQYETEAMEEMFEKNNYLVVDDDEIADIYVINTCTVTNLSDRKSRQFIRKSKKLNQDSLIAVVGCYSQISPEEVENIQGVDVIIGTTERNRVVELCETAKTNNEKINIVRNIKFNKEFEKINIQDVKDKTRAYLKIQDGCNMFCSYCIIPYARGPIRSRNVDEIIEEVKNLVDKGFKEFVLTGIHVASYGKDLIDISLIDVIRKIGLIPGVERIRLSSIEQKTIDDDFMKALVEIGKVCDHFHLSLQSGSNSILKRMNRKYLIEEYMGKVNLIRKYMPDAGITTDIIVGFPGETEEEFIETLKFANEVGFSKIHVFKFSPRKGTPAAEYEKQIDGNIKNDRSERLIKLGNELTHKFFYRYLEKNMAVLFEENKNATDIYEGYTTNYIRVSCKSDINLMGEIRNVNILSINEEILESELI